MMEPIKILLEISIKEDGAVYCVRHDKNYGEERKELDTNPPTEIKREITCSLWFKQIGDKAFRSCDGCKVACPVKGRYKGEPISI